MDSPLINFRFLRDPDEESVDLLAAYDEEDDEADDNAKEDDDTSRRTRNAFDSIELSGPEMSQSTAAPSPATQTLNQLSQEHSDLRYDHTQLEYDVAVASGIIPPPSTQETTMEDVYALPDTYPTTEEAEGIHEAQDEPTGTGEPAPQSADPSTFDEPSRVGLCAPATCDSDPVEYEEAKGEECYTKDSTTARAHSQAIEQLDIHGKVVIASYSSMRRATLSTKVPRHWIHAVLMGKREDAGGFRWRRCTQSVQGLPPQPLHPTSAPPTKLETPPTRACHSSDTSKNRCRFEVLDSDKNEVGGRSTENENCLIKRDGRSRPVEQLDANGIVVQRFPSMSQAESVTGIQCTFIRAALRDGDTSAGGYKWREATSESLIETVRNVDRSKSMSQTDSVSQGVAETKSRPNKVGGRNKRSENGLIKQDGRSRPVEQLDTNDNVVQRFPTMTQAESVTGIQRTFIRAALRDGDKTVGGYKWREANPDPLSESVRNVHPIQTDSSCQGLVETESQPVARSPWRFSAGKADVSESSDTLSEEQSQERGSVVKNASASSTAISSTGILAISASATLCASSMPLVEVLSENFTVHTVVIDGEGLLGFVASRCPTPPSLLATLKTDPSDSSESHCGFVKSFTPKRSLAHECGLLLNDIFLKPCQGGGYSAMSYPDILDTARNVQRPITFTVARRRDSISNRRKCIPITKPSSSDAVPLKDAEAKTDLPTAPAGNERVGGSTPPKGGAPLIDSDKSVAQRLQHGIDEGPATGEVPFCRKCKLGDGMAHHAWCPKHPQFLLSGAKDVLSRLHLGIEELGCSTCKKEFERGRRCEDAHSAACRDYRSAQASKMTTSGKRKRSDTEPRSSGGAVASSKQRLNTGSRPNNQARCVAIDFVRNEEVYKYDSDSSYEYKPSSRGRLCGSKNRGSKAVTTSTSVPPASKQRDRQLKPRMVTPSEGCDMTEDEVSDTEVVDINWGPSEDPWGSDGYQEGDAVTSTGRASSLSNIEALLPSPRIELDPFDTSRSYSATHFTPEEGFQVLELRRDPLAKLNWGFSIERHEFGGACLVNSVDPASPASSAVYLASSTQKHERSGLRVNDMIICLNGKRVGGMMVTELLIELEVAGPILTLVVSRCKLSDSVEHRLREAEKRYQSAVDEVLKDQRRLEFVDLISPIGQESNAMPDPGSAKDDSLVGDCALNVQESMEFSQGYQNSQPTQSLSDAIPDHGANSVREHFRIDGNDSVIAWSHKTAEPPIADMGRKCETQASTSNNAARQVRLAQDNDVSHHATSEQLEGSALDNDVVSDDRDNAWLGCVCGVVHDNSVPVFWIQCDSCKSWYNVSPLCVLFDENDAKHLPFWTCLGCGDLHELQNLDLLSFAHRSTMLEDISVQDTLHVEPASIDSPKGLTPSEGAITGRDDTWSSSVSATMTTNEEHIHQTQELDDRHVVGGALPKREQDSGRRDSSADGVVYSKGEIVFVEDYGPRDHGIASVLESYLDAHWGRRYDVKFIVGRKCKGVPAQFVKSYHF